jgi:hypothetical protein
VNKTQRIVILATAVVVAGVLVVSAMSFSSSLTYVHRDRFAIGVTGEVAYQQARLAADARATTVAFLQTAAVVLAVVVVGGALMVVLHKRKP